MNSEKPAAPPQNPDEIPKKSNAELRAERRKKQEEQRAAKLLKMGKPITQESLTGSSSGHKGEKQSGSGNPQQPKQQSKATPKQPQSEQTAAASGPPPPPDTFNRERRVSVTGSAQQQALRVPSTQRMDEPAQQKKMVRNLNRMQISQMRPLLTSLPPPLQHLPCYDTRAVTLSQSLKLGSNMCIKSELIAYAHRMERTEDVLQDSYEAVWLQLHCLSALIRKYRQPESEYFARDFLHYLARHVDFLNYCSPLPVHFRCLIDVLKQRLATFKPDTKEDECKKQLLEELDTFHQTRIHEPLKTIVHELSKHVSHGNHLLVMGGSGAWILCRALVHLHREFLKREGEHDTESSDWRPSLVVTVVDGAPLYVGRRLLRMLQEATRRLNLPPMKLRYALFTHLPAVLPHVDKVVLTAHALLSNSNVLSTVGSAGVAQMARHFHKPLLVVMETCNFWERKQADAFEFNHVLDPRLVLKEAASGTWRHGGEKERRAAKSLLAAVEAVETVGRSNSTTVASPVEETFGGTLKVHNMALDLITKECITRIINDFGSVLPACGSVLHRFKPGAEDSQET